LNIYILISYADGPIYTTTCIDKFNKIHNNLCLITKQLFLLN